MGRKMENLNPLFELIINNQLKIKPAWCYKHQEHKAQLCSNEPFICLSCMEENIGTMEGAVYDN